MPTTETVLSILQAGADAYGDAVALRFVDPAELNFDEAVAPQTLSYRQLLAKVTALANAYRAISGEASPVVSLLVPATLEGIVALLAAEVAGRANPINHYLAPDDLRESMRASGSHLAVANGAAGALPLWDHLMQVSQGLNLRGLIATDRSRPAETAHGTATPPRYALRALMAQYPADRLTEAAPQTTDCAALFNTAGTTGRPKIVPLTHGNLLAAARGIAKAWRFDPQTRIVNALPLFHVAGANLLLLGPLSAGAEVQIYSDAGLRNPLVLARHWDLVQHSRPTIIGGIPSSLIALLDIPTRGADLSSVQFCATGGAAMPAVAAEKFQRQFGLPIHTIYGMTECAGLIATAPVGAQADYATVGRLVEGTEIHLRTIGEGGALGSVTAVGPGGICVRGPQVFSGYLGAQEATLLPGGWLPTGDMGGLDENGLVVVSGRSKDIIIRSGNNIDPAVIEAEANAHPDIAASAAVAMPDSYAGEVPALFVVARKGKRPTVDAIEAHLRGTLSEPHARPAHVFFLEEMPLTRVGKVSRVELRRLAAEQAVKLVLAPASAEGLGVTMAEDGVPVVTLHLQGPEAKARIAALGLRIVTTAGN